MTAKEIQTALEKTNYWDVRLFGFDVKNFGDDVFLICDSGNGGIDGERELVLYHFQGCYGVNFSHPFHCPKVRKWDLTPGTSIYRMQDIQLEDVGENEAGTFFKATMYIDPMDLEIIFEKVDVMEVPRCSHKEAEKIVEDWLNKHP
jgi:hypothetical protein